MNRDRDMRRVSDTYRDISTETAPTNLDDRVMAMARQEARTRYGLARAWVRPVAWAATIGLSFAFILEMTYFSNEPPPVDAALPARIDDDAAQSAEPAAQEAPYKRAPATIVAAPEIKSDESPVQREAEERADTASAGFADEVAVNASARERASLAGGAHCDAEVRKSADTWYRCVLALRERGLAEAARTEFEALRETFPDFREPVPE